jgi:dihydroorotate dehydrogenase
VYKTFVRPILFLLRPELVHLLVVGFLNLISKIPGALGVVKLLFGYEHEGLQREVFGVKFSNPIGLAAGFDKDAKAINEFAAMGFGFIEIGTITPKPQPGNEKPRLFRLKADQALINRMGFNNEGLEQAVKQLKRKRAKVVIGGNIGKNKLTANDEAFRDYEMCFEALFDHVDYFAVNVSSPNTPNLRALQDKEPLKHILSRLMERNRQKKHPKPILLKIAPDLSNEQLDDIIEIVELLRLAGIVATNTTIARDHLRTDEKFVEAVGNGGLSGKPLRDRSTEVIRYLRSGSKSNFVIIGVGGVSSPADALQKLQAGANLVQIYTGFIYEGPSIVKKINEFLIKSGSF